MIDWQTTYDDNDNTVWVAPSPFTDGDGDAFCFRIKQKLEDNRHVFYDASDLECTLGGEEWPSIVEAMEAFEEAAANIRNEIANSQ